MGHITNSGRISNLQSSISNFQLPLGTNSEVMTIDYSIDEQDFLTFQLFTASRSEEIRKRRFKARLLPALILLAAGIFLLVRKDMNMAIMLELLAAAWYFFYPVREKTVYRNSYAKFISQNFKDKFGQKASMTLNDQFVINKDGLGESRIRFAEIGEINEISELILIKLKKGQSFILPVQKIANIDAFRDELKEIASKAGIPYSENLEWKWR